MSQNQGSVFAIDPWSLPCHMQICSQGYKYNITFWHQVLWDVGSVVQPLKSWKRQPGSLVCPLVLPGTCSRTSSRSSEDCERTLCDSWSKGTCWPGTKSSSSKSSMSSTSCPLAALKVHGQNPFSECRTHQIPTQPVFALDVRSVSKGLYRKILRRSASNG